MKLSHPLALAACLVVLTGVPAAAQEPASSAQEGWSTIVEPYFLLPNMSGETGVESLTADVDAGSGDILGALDFGAMLYLEMHDPRWAFALDTMYMNLGAEGTTAVGTVEIDMKQLGVMGAGYRRVAPWAEALLALQYNGIEAGLTGSGPLGVDVSDEKSWLDPYVGVRLMTPGSDRWRFGIMGAIGGFGVGSDFAWQVYPQAGYRVSESFEITGAFRAVDMDYEDDSGNAAFVYDMTTYGAQLGVRFHL